MGEEVRPDEAVAEWEAGLPSAADLTPLTQSLIPAELASAFKISPEPTRTAVDVDRASQTTLSSLRSNPFSDPPEDADEPDPDPDPKKARRGDDAADEDQSASKNSKKPRLVWTAELHKRFIEVVAYLGLKNAVPKTIMQMMNVDGLTRENVASHLQKYRLYMRRQGYSEDDNGPLPLPSDNRVLQQIAAESSNGNNNNSNSQSYGQVGMPMPMLHHYHPQMMMASNGHGFHTHHHHHNQQQQQSHWSGNSSKYSNHAFQNKNQ